MISRRTIAWQALAIAAILLIASLAAAQNPSTSVHGNISDISGAMIRGAQVALLDSQQRLYPKPDD